MRLQRLSRIDDKRLREALRFGLRYAITVGLSSLFVLLPYDESKDSHLPEPTAIVVTAVLVGFFKTSGGALERGILRMLGTLLGATLAMFFGWIATKIPTETGFEVFIGSFVTLVAFSGALCF